MISIRLSDQEYRALKNHCLASGDLKASEFVRAALMHALASPEFGAPPTYLELQIATLFERLAKLDQKLAGIKEHGTGNSSAVELL
jgi:hypothetical protein